MSNTIINTNVTALNSHRALGSVGNRQAKSAERLSTGQRINRAGDDAAGLAISEKMRSQIRGLDQATRNSQDGISLIQTAEGALEEVHSILQRVNELTNQASNGTLTEGDREKIAEEISELLDEVQNIAETTQFNEKHLLRGGDGSATTRPGREQIRAKEDWEDELAKLQETTDGTNQTEIQEHLNKLPEGWAVNDKLELTWIGTPNEAQVAEQEAWEGKLKDLQKAIEAVDTGDAGGAILEEALAEHLKNPPKGFEVKSDDDDKPDGLKWVGIKDTLNFSIQTGANSGERLNVSIDSMDLAGLGLDEFHKDFSAAVAIEDNEALSDMLDTLSDAISTVSTQRANLGAVQNRLEHTVNNLQVASENLSAANSRIRDTDMAKEMMNLTQANVLQQAATSMLAQANQAPQQVLQLLG